MSDSTSPDDLRIVRLCVGRLKKYSSAYLYGEKAKRGPRNVRQTINANSIGRNPNNSKFVYVYRRNFVVSNANDGFSVGCVFSTILV